MLALGICSSARAHELRPGYLEIRESSPDKYDVLWKVPARGETERLALFLRFAPDVQQLSEPIDRIAGQAHIRQLRIARPGGLAGTAIAIDGLAATYTDVLLRLEYLDGSEITHRLTADHPVYVVEAEPSLAKVAWTYLVLGVEHILLGIDHLLFVLALLMIVKGWGKLVGTITAFTLAHSITLALATLGFVDVPGAPVEAIIALSIVFVAAEILRESQGEPGLTARQPWIVAFTFGLLHGFGFAGALSEIGLPSSSIPLALLTFNVGVELGQLIFVAAILLVWLLVRRIPVKMPAWAWAVPAYAIGGVAAYWVIDRVSWVWAA